MLTLSDVRTDIEATRILHGVSLTAPEGTCTTILGRNGMGKTTLIRSVIGLLKPASGSVNFDGAELVGMPPFQIARLGVALVPQGRRVFPSLRVEENLMVAATRAGDNPRWTTDRVFELFPRLEERRRAYAGTLSGGEQQMLAIGRALMTNPRFLLMDEPSEGLAPIIVRRLRDVIGSIVDDGLSVLLVEQNLRLGLDLGNQVYILSKGEVVWEGVSDQLDEDPAAQKRWLGI